MSEDCHKCKGKTSVGEYSGSKCSMCPIVLCRRCDDASNFLIWWGKEAEDKDGTDYYLCPKCVKKHTKKSKPVRVVEIPATEDNAYKHTPTAPSS